MLANLLRWTAVLSVVGVSAYAFEPGPSYKKLEAASAVKPASANSAEHAALDARGQFDEPIDPMVFTPLPKGETVAEVPTLRPAGDFVVGKPQQLSEPKNPIDEKDEPKDKGGGGGWKMKLLGAILGGLIVGGLGFLVGGPIGAAVGFASGAIGGWSVTH